MVTIAYTVLACLVLIVFIGVLINSNHSRRVLERREIRDNELEMQKLQLEHQTLNPPVQPVPESDSVLIEREKTKQLELEIKNRESLPEVLIERAKTSQLRLQIDNRETPVEVLVERERVRVIQEMSQLSKEYLEKISDMERDFIQARPDSTLMDYKEFSSLRDSLNDSLAHIKEVFVHNITTGSVDVNVLKEIGDG